MMNIWDIAKTVGAGALNVVLPGAGSAMLGVVNELLPDGKKLPDGATGHDVAAAIQAMPADKRAELMEKKFDVDLAHIKESNASLRAMLAADATNTHSTRPYIAKGSFLVVAFSVIVTMSLWAVSVFNNDDSTVQVIVNGWPFVLAVMTPLVTLLYAYFGVLKEEHKNKLATASGGTPESSGIAGVLAAVLKR